MAKNWLSLTVELVEGGGYRFWPRPGRVFAAARTHTFAQLATAIDISFGRWDIAHQWQFELAGNVFVAPADPDWQSGGNETLVDGEAKLTRLVGGDEFVYQFDLGNSWLHICRVGRSRVDPLQALGDAPLEPTPYHGWGILPDQYLRRFADDDGEKPAPVDQRNRDLPPFRAWWGPEAGAPADPADSADSAG